MEQSKIINKIKGSLYGFVIGDAMGATTEFRDSKYIKENYGIVRDIVGGGVFNFPAGHGTDDTAMTLCVCDAIEYAYSSLHKNSEELMLDRCCTNFINWLKYDGLGCGRCCYESISGNVYSESYKEWIQNNIEPSNLPDEKRRLGNGSLMRTMPIILAGLSKETAISQGRLTHNNKTCDCAIEIYYQNLEELLYHDTFMNTVAQICEPTGHVFNTLNNSLYWVQHTDSLEGAIIKAVNHGGDADTIAAITGSLAGAYYGYDKIPQRWVSQLSDNVKSDLDKYAKLFEKINKKYVQNTNNIV